MAVLIPGVNQVYRRLRVLPLVGSRVKRPHLLITRESSTPFAESFRLLALNVGSTLAREPHKAVVVMSAHPGDGRSLIAANLAIALAERNPTVLGDADSQATTPVGSMFKVDGGGRSDGLPEALRQVVKAADRPGLWLTSTHQSHVGDRDGLQEIIGAASTAEIFTVLDSPPATVSSEAFFLAREVGQVVYVVRRVAQDMEVHRHVREQLRRLDAQIIGLVVNEA